MPSISDYSETDVLAVGEMLAMAPPAPVATGALVNMYVNEYPDGTVEMLMGGTKYIFAPDRYQIHIRDNDGKWRAHLTMPIV